MALLTENFAATGNEMGLFEKIDASVVTNLDNLYDFAKNADGYGPCYSLVRYGIIYNEDLVAAPDSYEQLFTDEQYAGLVSIPDMSGTAGRTCWSRWPTASAAARKTWTRPSS